MTNEEIIKITEEEYLTKLTPMTKQLVLKMLDQARKEEAVEFAKFM